MANLTGDGNAGGKNGPGASAGTGKPSGPPHNTAPNDGGSGDVVRTGFLWNLLNFVFAQGAGIAIFLVLSRQISVATFGVFALAALLVDLFATNARWASIDALVQRQDFAKKTLSSAFWVLMAASLVLAGVFALAAEPIATAIDEPDLVAVLPVMGLTLILTPGAAIMDAILMRDLKFRSQAIRNILATLIGGSAGIAVAFGPAPEWALVAQRAAASLVTLVVMFVYTRWLPTFEFSGGVALGFARRMGQLWASMMLATAHMRVVEACIGARAGVESLGLLRVAQRFHEALQGPITGPIQALWVPVLSKIRSDKGKAWRLFLDLSRVAAFVALPAFVGLGLISSSLIALALDDRYQDAASLLFWIGLSGFLVPVGFFGNQVFAALDRSDLAMKISAVALVLVSPAVWVASAYGVEATLVTSIAVMGCVGVSVTVLQIRLMGGTVVAFVRHLSAPYLSTIAMAAVVLSVSRWLPFESAALRLVCEIAAGGVVFCGWMIVFHRKAVLDTWKFISFVRSSEPEPADAVAPAVATAGGSGPAVAAPGGGGALVAEPAR